MANSFGGNQQEGVRTRQPDHPSEGGRPASKSGKKFDQAGSAKYLESDNRPWVVSKAEDAAHATQSNGVSHQA